MGVSAGDGGHPIEGRQPGGISGRSGAETGKEDGKAPRQRDGPKTPPKRGGHEVQRSREPPEPV